MTVGEWKTWGLALVVMAGVGQAVRAGEDQPSRQTLEQMGLSGLTVMSDDDAMSVRGMGFQGGHSMVRVTGSSFATINGPNGNAHSENAYIGEGKHFAAGANGSVAGVIHISSGHGGKKGNNDDWKMTRSPGGNWGNMGGGTGHGKGRINVRATVFFAGGFSFAVAH